MILVKSLFKILINYNKKGSHNLGWIEFSDIKSQNELNRIFKFQEEFATF